MSTIDYFQMYLDKVKEYGFSEPHIAGIIRYLLVNGLIEPTPEHLALMGDTEFYFDKSIPEAFVKEVNEHYATNPDGDIDEEYELDELEFHGYELKGVWFKGGEVTGYKMEVTRTVKVQNVINFSMYDGRLSDAKDGECEQCGHDYDPETGICQHCGYHNDVKQ